MNDVLAILGDLIRGAMAHSECVALFAILLIQQWAMHIVNTRKIDSVPRKVEAKLQEAIQLGDNDDVTRG